MSASKTTAVVGDIIMVNTSITQQPHGGISLSANGSFVRNPSFDCDTRGHSVLDHEVIYYCTARKSGAITIQANVVFCSIDWSSQTINISIKEDDSNSTKLSKRKAMVAAYVSIISIWWGFYMCIL